LHYRQLIIYDKPFIRIGTLSRGLIINSIRRRKGPPFSPTHALTIKNICSNIDVWHLPRFLTPDSCFSNLAFLPFRDYHLSFLCRRICSSFIFEEQLPPLSIPWFQIIPEGVFVFFSIRGTNTVRSHCMNIFVTSFPDRVLPHKEYLFLRRLPAC